MKKIMSLFLATVLLGGALTLSTAFRDKTSTSRFNDINGESNYITATQTGADPFCLKFNG